jgi:hypothetical protein
MRTNQSRLAAPFLLCLLSVLALAACAGQSPTIQTASPTPPVSSASPTPTMTTALAAFVGTWVSHDDQLTIAANGIGVENWSAGPCVGQGTSGLCAGAGDLTFTAHADGSLTGAYQSVAYTSSGGPLPASYLPPSGYPVVGSLLTLKHDGVHILAALVNGNSFNYCDPTALSQAQCGA